MGIFKIHGCENMAVKIEFIEIEFSTNQFMDQMPKAEVS